MIRFKNIAGQRFGRLTALRRTGDTGHCGFIWECQCDCGNLKHSDTGSLTSGNVKSCGCLRVIVAKQNGAKNATHGIFRGRKHTGWAASKRGLKRTWTSWVSMRHRCHSCKHHAFSRYGGRGITVCERWNDFKLFLEDMGIRPAGHSIERINNDGNYCQSNCKWATGMEQGRNKRNNRLITINGITKHLAGWSLVSGISTQLIWQRIKKGWTWDRVLSPAR